MNAHSKSLGRLAALRILTAAAAQASPHAFDPNSPSFFNVDMSITYDTCSSSSSHETVLTVAHSPPGNGGTRRDCVAFVFVDFGKFGYG